MPDAADPVLDQARRWRDADPDPRTRSELDALVRRAASGDAEARHEVAERFAGRLAFGTAGLRAELGAGPLRMNRVVVRQAAAGLAAWLGPGRTVVIGFDARHQSDQFARDTAQVMAAAGLSVELFADTCPTPVLAFAVRELRTDAGVMCTASHNPAQDNGYKVYLGDGAQIVPPVDTEIESAIAQVASSPEPPALADPDDPAIKVVGPAMTRAYLDHVATATGGGVVTGGAVVAGRGTVTGRHELRIAYTPLHGVGGATAVAALGRAGFDRVAVVAEQFEPDPEFPTVPFPNPEEPGALDRVTALARATGAQLVLANDPDADRLAVMVPASVSPLPTPDADRGDWVALTGNQIGALLADHVLAVTDGDDRLVVTTSVSSQLLSRQAAAAGVHYAEVATGFKWVVRPGLDHPGLRFVFGYEEALGYSVDEMVRDKDGISAAVCFAQLAEAARAQGTTVWDRLDALGRRFGEHVTGSWSWRAEGSSGQARMAETMAGLRDRPPVSLGGVGVRRWRDLSRPTGPEPPADALVVELADGSRICLRPSGTEPKLKAYVEVVEVVDDGPEGPARARARGSGRTRGLATALAAEWLEPMTSPG